MKPPSYLGFWFAENFLIGLEQMICDAYLSSSRLTAKPIFSSR
jgi:hypothetical protein